MNRRSSTGWSQLRDACSRHRYGIVLRLARGRTLSSPVRDASLLLPSTLVGGLGGGLAGAQAFTHGATEIAAGTAAGMAIGLGINWALLHWLGGRR